MPRRGRRDARGDPLQRERLAAAAADELLAATDIADLLVRRGVRSARLTGSSPGLVRSAIDSGKPLSELTPEELAAAVAGARRASSTRVLAQGAWLESKVSEGGTSLARVREQLDARARRVLSSRAEVRDAAPLLRSPRARGRAAT